MFMKKALFSLSVLVILAATGIIRESRVSTPASPVATTESQLTQEQASNKISDSNPPDKNSHCHGCATPPPMIAGELILLMRDDGYVYAVNAATGSKRWMSGGG